jgi:hypothetical protein
LVAGEKEKINSMGPEFRALGDAAALVYETIERSGHSPTSVELIRNSGISRSTVEKALVAMEGLSMIHRDGRHWKITATANLRALAERMGVMEDYQAHISRNRRERAAWRAVLGPPATDVAFVRNRAGEGFSRMLSQKTASSDGHVLHPRNCGTSPREDGRRQRRARGPPVIGHGLRPGRRHCPQRGLPSICRQRQEVPPRKQPLQASAFFGLSMPSCK